MVLVPGGREEIEGLVQSQERRRVRWMPSSQSFLDELATFLG
jgi:hypothetical protein